MIPYGRQDINESDVQHVIEVLKSAWLTQGPTIPKFEKQVAEYCGAKHALAMNSATAALHLSLSALGVKAGDSVWTSPNTFVASSNSALYCGANVNFIDIELQTFNMDLNVLEERLKKAKETKTLPKVVIPVHFGGLSVDMKALRTLADTYDFKIVEDASHAVGAKFFSQPVGSCRYSDLTVFSFHPVKIITTGEGGMVLTNNSELHEKIFQLRSHGITRDPKLMTKTPDGPWYYEQQALGFNYRITDIQAALGSSQFTRLEEFVARRRALAKNYIRAFEGLPISWQKEPASSESSYHLFVICFKDSRLREQHRFLHEEMIRRGIGVNLHYIPVYKQPYYKNNSYFPCPQAEEYYSQAMSLPLFPTLSEKDQSYVIQQLKLILSDLKITTELGPLEIRDMTK